MLLLTNSRVEKVGMAEKVGLKAKGGKNGLHIWRRNDDLRAVRWRGRGKSGTGRNQLTSEALH
ncbi:MAG: hypothetical protein M3Z35_00855, partial [Nitrospirota bacterium]|nr:hypothetical protein [Nitrospirota bacterium]